MSVSLSTSAARDVSTLPARAREDFYRWRDRIAPLLGMSRGVLEAISALAKTTGEREGTIKNKLYAARKHGILALVDRRLAGPSWWNQQTPDACNDLPPEDRELVKLYCEKNDRSSRSACKQLQRDWRAGKVFTKRPLNLVTGYPDGWSLDNLLRYVPTKFELAASRKGRAAASAHRPLVYTSRKDLWVGSHYMFDDMWHDFMVNSFAEKQAGRPLELFSHDLYSGRKVRWGFRVRTQREDGTNRGLTEAMTRMILAATLHRDGYSPLGTVLVAEHGTAAIREQIETALHDISGGLITVSRSGMQGAAAHAGQYPGIVRGNPRHKASLESSNNLTHNVFGALPGQVGKDRQSSPEQLGALMRNNDALLAAYEKLSPERQALLEFLILDTTQFQWVAEDLYAAIENDHAHDLSDWTECGHVVQELLLGGAWTNQAALMQGDAAAQELALALIGSGKIQTRPRRMTRREVWNAGAANLVKLPGHGVVAILGDDMAVERKVRSGMFEFEDAEAGAGVTFRFDSVAWDSFGRRVRLPEGETYKALLNPFDTGTLYISKADGSYIGECRTVNDGVPSRGAELEVIHRAMGKAAATEAELLQPIRLRHMQEAREKLARHKRNVDVLSGKPVTREEKADAAETRDRIRAERGNIDDFLTPAATAQPEQHDGPSLEDFT